MKEEEKFICQ